MSLASFLIGGLAWSAGEYAIHRFVGHGPKRQVSPTRLGKFTLKGIAAEFNSEHLAHHADPRYFAPTSRKLRAAAIGVPLLGALAAPFFGVRRSTHFALGFGLVYGGYEVIHRHIHTRPPGGRYGAWVRHHHLLHHHKTPRHNHGVTSPLWDIVCSSYTPIEVVRIPRHAAPSWLLDEQGEVQPQYRAQYELVGKREQTVTPKTAST
jgi:hypothetical protein